jgi:integrase/recombinase XerD
VLVRLLYASGGRVTEIATLRWRDLVLRDNGGQVTLFGKGGKTRAVLLPAGVWADLEQLARHSSTKGTLDPDAPVFRSRRRGGHLTERQIERVVSRPLNVPVSRSPSHRIGSAMRMPVMRLADARARR